MKIIFITYKKQTVLVKIIENYKAQALNDSDKIFNQCRDCGSWCSKDDIFYDKYCSKCVVKCYDCGLYHHNKTMHSINDYQKICKECYKIRYPSNGKR